MKTLLKFLFPTRADLSANKAALWQCVASALFGGLLFHQNMLGILAWTALVPLFMALHRLTGKMLFWGALAFGFTWYYLGVFWLHTLVVFHWMIPVGVVAGSLYIGFYFVLFAIPAAWCCRQLGPSLRPWAIATCWTGVEYLRNFSDMAFPWNLLGHSQAPWNMLHMGLASFGGVYLLSFLIALINAAIAVFVIALRTHPQRSSASSFVRSMTLPLLTVLAGTLLVAGTQRLKENASDLRVSIIQPGISQLEKWTAMMGLPTDTPATAQQRYMDVDRQMQEAVVQLTREVAVAEKPQLIVMPESIFLAGYFPYATQLQDQLLQLSKQANADLFFGADNLMERALYDEQSAQGQRFLFPGESPTTASIPSLPVLRADDGTTSPDMQSIDRMAAMVSAWHISRNHGIESRVYNKMQLVPFGEQVPFLSGFDWLRNKLELSGIAGAYKPGLQNTTFEVQGSQSAHAFGAVICFESTFSYLPRQLALAGAQFVCVLTNDSWYDPNYAISQGGFWGSLFRVPGLRQLASAGPKQHLAQSQFRAIETGLPVVRSANTGISAFINKRGAIKRKTDYGTSGHITSQLHLDSHPRPTFFVRYGEWFGKLCLGIWLSVVCLLLLTRPKTSGSRFALPK